MPPHAPCRLQRGKEKCNEISASLPPHAPCRLQRFINSTDEIEVHLCLHTLRADCNGKEYRKPASHNLCLHTLRADCNLRSFGIFSTSQSFASTRSVQIATWYLRRVRNAAGLCLHTLRADCNERSHPARRLGRPLPPHAPCRLQRQKCTELQYALFRTCVELVDSFSVLNKAMLR